jgi:thiosulfate/3-mercaptopyruvate sulfurtransferase
MATEVPHFVSTEWLNQHLNDADLRLIEATTFLKIPAEGGYYDTWSGQEVYDQDHIPGAVYADLKHDFSDPTADYNFAVIPHDDFVQKASALGIDDDSYVVVYDRGPQVDVDFTASDWASRFAWQLKFEGFDNVAILDGSYQKWVREDRPTTAEAGAYPAGHLTIDRRPELYADKEDVLAAIEDDNTIILDSLSKESYEGKADTYARPGHIPGAANVFFGELSEPDSGELYDDDKLKSIFKETGALDKDKKVITYCGSAIAATWTQTLLNKLGQENVSVYDGSLSEWAEDDSLPLETN